MKKIVAFGASNSSTSINKVFVAYVANKLTGVQVQEVDMNDYELPLYSPDLEKEAGIPENALRFNELITLSDGLVISMAEYNGLFTTAFKNLFDWLSRIDQNIWKHKPMLLMAASPGGRGGANVLRVSKDLLPHFGGKVVASFSLPSYFKNFKEGELVNDELHASLKEQINVFEIALNTDNN